MKLKNFSKFSDVKKSHKTKEIHNKYILLSHTPGKYPTNLNQVVGGLLLYEPQEEHKFNIKIEGSCAIRYYPLFSHDYIKFLSEEEELEWKLTTM